ncbi:MAG: HAMP domain-containing histidine kinase [Lachnospiraceae bacterium]|nr:HAMP domain-containing histidine kinase [Lachnospiraceae bacterium]
MKLFHKIFLCFVVIFGITFQVAGYLFINFAYENAIDQEKKIAFQDFQYNRYILQSILYSEPELFTKKKDEIAGILRNFTVPVYVYGLDQIYDFTNMTALPEEIDFNEVEDDKVSFQIYEKEGENYIFVYDYVRQGKNELYLATQTNISAVIEKQKNMIAYFQRIYIVILCISFPLIFLLTKALTASLKKVGEASRRIAKGNYSQRICTEGKDEIGELALDFNHMAEQVEEKMAELSNVAKQKEEFAASFAHELKTPLTSVIGYADMLYQRDLSREDVKSAAGYILDEGMRLESLSLKLMDLFVLDKQDFLLEKMSVEEIFANIRLGIEPICEKYNVVLHMKIEDGTVWVDFDLFKTMILNLVDNAIKAGCRELWISGRQNTDYQIEIKDNGKGIPPEELGRITEAFYMIDKSRSRKQHGAGLGLALVSKIADLHGVRLEIESDGKTGTAVSMVFEGAQGDWNEKDI